MMRGAADLPALDIDPFAPEVLRDPEEFHEALREAGDFAFLPRYGICATGRYDRVRAILTDWEAFGSSGGVGVTNFHREGPWRPPSLVLERDPPDHTRYRAILMRALGPGVLRGWRAAFEAEARRSLERRLDLAEFDAVAELAEGYPLKVFGDAVGIRATDRRLLLRYGDISFNALGPRNALFESAMAEQAPVTAWIMAQCARDALDPGGLGAILYAAADAGEVTGAEAGMLVRSLLSAGVDTTVRALGTALLCFADHPEQWRLLRDNPQLARSAAEESIRYGSPFQTLFRTTTAQVALAADTTLGPDEKILLSLGAANRDGRRWEAPDRFDIARKAGGHVGFGAGIHVCAGQMIARLEMEVLLGELARGVGRIERAGDFAYGINNTTRGLSALPVRITAP
jgi:cytochrome P450